VLLEENRLPEARTKLEDSLKIRKEIGNPEMVGDSLLALAQLTLEEGRPAEAEKLARDAAADFATVKSLEDEAVIDATLVRALLAQQKLADARVVSDHALSLKTNGSQPQFESILAAAGVHAASGKSAEAGKKLNEVMVKAEKLNFVGYEFSARLQLDTIQIKSGQFEAARKDIESLERDTKAKDYFLIARKAAELAHPVSGH
jgi:hypothetical protein